MQVAVVAGRTWPVIMACPGSCYTAGDTQAALYLAAALSALSPAFNRAPGHFLSPHREGLRKQLALEMKTRSFT